MNSKEVKLELPKETVDGISALTKFADEKDSIWSQKEREEVGAVLVEFVKCKRYILNSYNQIAIPIKEGLTALTVQKNIQTEPLEKAERKLRKLNEQWDVTVAKKGEDERLRLQAIEAAKAKEVSLSVVDKLSNKEEITKEEVIASHPKTIVTKGLEKKTSSAGTSSVKVKKKWRVYKKSTAPSLAVKEKANDFEWDKTSRCPVQDIAVTKNFVHSGCDYLYRLDSTAINKSFEAGEELPPWVDIYDGTVETIRTKK